MSIFADVRQAVRGLRRAPGFAAAAIVTLALGIGANTAVFSVVNGVLLRPLPYPDPDRIVYMSWDWGEGQHVVLSSFKYDWYRRNATSFAGVTTMRSRSATLGADERAREVGGQLVDDAFFAVFRMRPMLGRLFAPDEYVAGGGSVVLLGHDLWRTEFGADPGVVGRVVQLGQGQVTVVGVMPADFQTEAINGPSDFLMPFRLEIDPQDQGHNHVAIARVADGSTREAAQAELDALTARFRTEYPNLVDSERERMRITDYATLFVGSGLQRTLWTLLGAVGFVLLIACTNVANLLLVRASDRRREIAIRVAIGGARRRILRQLLTESLVIAAIAGVVGITAGMWTVDALLAIVPGTLPRTGEIGLDVRVLGFALALALVTGIIFGLAAAAPVLRGDVIAILREGDRGAGAGRGARRVRSSLVVAEAAIACVLLAGASLLITSFARLRAVDPGFDTANIISASFSRLPPGMDATQSWSFQERALAQLAQQPGVEAAATASNLPLQRGWNMPVMVVGRPDASESVEWRAISPSYFEVLDIERVSGRAFDQRDAGNAPPVVIVNEMYAQRHFPDGNAIGQRVQIGAFNGEMLIPMAEPERAIVGVVADVKEIGLAAPARSTVYVPFAQIGWTDHGPPRFLVRTATGGPTIPAAALPRAFADADPRMPPPRVQSLADIMSASLAQDRFNTLLMTLFAALALALTAVGLYGVLAYTVRQRTREIGIRMALGASRNEVLRMVIGNGIALAAAGLAIGILAALWLTRLITSMLYDVQPGEPLAYVFVAVLLLGIAVVASYLPATRAMRVPPMVALRVE